MAGTDPRDAQSYLRIDSARLSPQGAEVTFKAQANRGYTVQFRESPDHGRWQTLKQVNGRGAPSQETVVDPLPLSRARFYRLVTPQQFQP